MRRGWILALLVLAGCGQSAAPRHCHPGDQTMACILRQQPRPAPNLLQRPLPAVYGVDFGWSCPNTAAFGASYLSYDASKDWTRSCVDAYHHRGAATVAVFESAADRAQAGYQAGYRDAKHAAAELATLAAPPGQPFTMAIDCDCDPQTLTGYFQGANAAEPGRVNAYGGYRQILYLSQHGLVGHLDWQTYAWSGGLWLPASIAPLEQYLNANSVDYDRALAANYGQWPYAPPKPRPVRLKCWGPHAKPHHPTCERLRPLLARQSRARDATVHALGRNACRLPYRRRVCRTLGQRRNYFAARIHAELSAY